MHFEVISYRDHFNLGCHSTLQYVAAQADSRLDRHQAEELRRDH